MNDTQNPAIADEPVQTEEPKKAANIKSLEKELKQEREAREKMESQINKLMKVASKRKLDRLKTPDEPGKLCDISLHKGKVVTSWKSISNISDHDGETNQVSEITCEDGTTHKMSTKKFLTTGLKKEEVDILGISHRDGKSVYTIEYNDKEYDIDVTFLN